jgi:hypothetical protein
MVFIDDYTRARKVYFMKDHAAATIIEFTDKYIHDHAMVNGLHLQRLRTDCASEFLGEAYTEYCFNSGIKRETSPPYDHARNGVAERRIKELAAIARCLLTESGLGPALWAEAWEAANIIENITPSTAAPPGTLTFMNAWTGNITHLGKQRTFGAYAFVLIPRDRRTKMSANAWKRRVLSYNFDLQSWRVYRPDKNRVFVTSQVCFVESKVEALALTQSGVNRVAARAAKHAKYSKIVHASNNNDSEHDLTSETDRSNADGDLLICDSGSDDDVSSSDNNDTGDDTNNSDQSSTDTLQEGQEYSDKIRRTAYGGGKSTNTKPVSVSSKKRLPAWQAPKKRSEHIMNTHIMNTRRTAGSALLATTSRQHVNTTEVFTSGDYGSGFNMKTVRQCEQYTSAQVSELCFTDRLQQPWEKKLSAIALTASHISVDPRSRSQAMAGPFAEQRFAAEQAELQSLIDCDAFELVTPPQAAMVLNGTREYATKFKDGKLAQFKARFVADGRNQL